MKAARDARPTTRWCRPTCIAGPRGLTSAENVQKVIDDVRRAGGTQKLPTMVDATRLRATVALAVAALQVQGDFVELGVFKGGTSILMMRVLDAQRDGRRIFACDSFEGLPAADAEQDRPSQAPASGCMSRGRNTCLHNEKTAHLSRKGELSSSLQSFYHNLAHFNVSTHRLRVVKGWFSDTLPPAGLQRIAFLRLDGDLYNSTMEGLVHLEPLVAPGGYVYVDDYGAFRGCGAAVDQYLASRGLAPTLNLLPNRYNRVQALWWRKDAA